MASDPQLRPLYASANNLAKKIDVYSQKKKAFVDKANDHDEKFLGISTGAAGGLHNVASLLTVYYSGHFSVIMLLAHEFNILGVAAQHTPSGTSRFENYVREGRPDEAAVHQQKRDQYITRFEDVSARIKEVQSRLPEVV
jgi:hypothetical protein